MQKRLLKVISWLTLTIGIGSLYALAYSYNKLRIPCLFYQLTGFECPGCGVTRMCMALVRLDFKAAFFYHPVIMMYLPVGLLIGMHQLINYVTKGKTKLSIFQTKVLWSMAISLIGFGFLRNIV